MDIDTDTSRPLRIRRYAALLAVLGVALLGVAGCRAAGDPSAGPIGASPTGPSDDLDRGVLPGQTTAFDEELPGIANLDSVLRAAVQEATHDAEADDVQIFINSGWRSPELQTQLLENAVAEYGSREEAARWVSTPETSAHVTGDAVDIGDMDAYLWLSERGRGSAYGLCQIYSNEAWHFEYVPTAKAEGCPEQYLDPTHDPRMQE